MARSGGPRDGQRWHGWLAVSSVGLVLVALTFLVVRQVVPLPSPPGAPVSASASWPAGG